MQVYQFFLWRQSLLVTMVPLDWKQICTSTSQNNNSLKSLSHPIQTADVEMKISCLWASEMFLPQQSASHHLPLGPKGQSVPNGLRSLFVILQTCKEKKKRNRHQVFGLVKKKMIAAKTFTCLPSLHETSRAVWEFDLEFWFSIDWQLEPWRPPLALVDNGQMCLWNAVSGIILAQSGC